LSDLGRARLAGVSGTLLGFLTPFILVELLIVTGNSDLFGLEVPLSSAITLALVGYAVWKLSVFSGDSEIFRFYLGFIAFEVVFDATFLMGLYLAPNGSLAFEAVDYLARVAGAVFLYAAFAKITATMGYDLFLWTARFTLLGAVIQIATYFETTYSPILVLLVSLVSFVFQVISFNSLKGKSPEPPPPPAGSAVRRK